MQGRTATERHGVTRKIRKRWQAYKSILGVYKVSINCRLQAF